jgi:parallel beta-helix repeat protein
VCTGLLAAVAISLPPSAGAAVLEVPADYSTVQSAINAALAGDVVVLDPGVYRERPTISGKRITLASRYHTTGDRAYIDQTILDGNNGTWALRVLPGDGEVEIVGLTLRNADDGLRATGKVRFVDNRVTATGDGIDFGDGSGGLVKDCVFEGNSDDGIDLDNGVSARIEGNVIRSNGDDGIEIRFQAYTGPRLFVTIRDNLITGNGSDGIQLISYDLSTPRTVHIEHNLILDNAKAGVGMMCCQRTVEDYQGAPLKETIGLFHNTISGNDHGVTGGDSLIALNNLILGSKSVGMKRVAAGSIAAHNLFFGNGTDHVDSNVEAATTLYQDPLLRPDLELAMGSPAIDAGCARFLRDGELVWRKPLDEFQGTAPDLGALESPAPLSVDPRPAGGGVELLPLVPNPSRGPTRFEFVAPAADRVRLEVLDLSGRQVRLLLDGVVAAGRHELAWDGRDSTGRTLPPGAYFARLTSDARSRTRRFTRLE